MTRRRRFAMPDCRRSRRQVDAAWLALVVCLTACTPPSLAAATPPRTLLTFAGGADARSLGSSVASAGDFNGDGHPDLLVGAPGIGAEIGHAYVYFGGPGADAVPDITFAGEAPGDGFGESVAPAGDVNGDGHGDVLVGAPWNDFNGTDAGRAYVFYGGPGADVTPDLTFLGNLPYLAFGYTLASAGDIDGDGFDEVIVGSAREQSSGSSSAGAGVARVCWGGPNTNSFNSYSLRGAPANDLLYGHAVASAGDLNGDGFGDVVVGAETWIAGATYHDRVYVYYGGPRTSALAVADLILSDGTARGRFGRAVAPAGDVNGDGLDDLLVGAYDTSEPGHAYVYHGGSTPDATADLDLSGPAYGGLFGWSVASAGDVNRDGHADLAVGSWEHEAGEAFVYHGGPAADTGADFGLVGAELSAWFGRSVAPAGDVDGDGYDELIVGAPGTAGRTGRAYVISFAPVVLPASLDLDPDVVNVLSRAPYVAGYIEIQGVDPATIDPSTVRLVGIVPADPKIAAIGDYDVDGVGDLMVRFSRTDLEPLLVLGTNRLEVSGSLITGESFKGADEIKLMAPSAGPHAASLSPNPLNPAGVLTFETSRAGRLRVVLHDVRGRAVRTLAESAYLPAGRHEVVIDGRDEHGVPMASGVYFYQIDSDAGALAGRLVVLK